MFNRVDEFFMQEALSLAAKGQLGTAPNPMVGAVIVKNNQIIGQGYHQIYGQAHAEVNALADCLEKNNDPAGATMFVTLEPCCHFGKTPPCTQAIIDAKIKKVFVATIDNSLKVAGKGLQILRDHNIEVEVGLCQNQARQLNAGFFKLQSTGYPLVILKWAQSIDAKLAWPADSDKRWITNQAARYNVHQLRARCGAILVGVKTVLADNPMLDIREVEFYHKILRTVIDRQLQIPLDSKLAQSASDWPLLIYSSQQAIADNPDKVRALQGLGAEIMPVALDNNHLSLQGILKDLGSRQILQLIIEGGPQTLMAFHSQRLADKLMVYIAPIIIGHKGLPINFNLQSHPGSVNITQLEDNILYEIDGSATLKGY